MVKIYVDFLKKTPDSILSFKIYLCYALGQR